jgi:hypothetical protein
MEDRREEFLNRWAACMERVNLLPKEEREKIADETNKLANKLYKHGVTSAVCFIVVVELYFKDKEKQTTN